MPNGEITVTVKDGKVEVSVNGVKGQGCQALTRALEEELGAVKTDTPTREMYEREVSMVAERVSTRR